MLGAVSWENVLDAHRRDATYTCTHTDMMKGSRVRVRVPASVSVPQSATAVPAVPVGCRAASASAEMRIRTSTRVPGFLQAAGACPAERAGLPLRTLLVIAAQPRPRVRPRWGVHVAEGADVGHIKRPCWCSHRRWAVQRRPTKKRLGAQKDRPERADPLGGLRGRLRRGPPPCSCRGSAADVVTPSSRRGSVHRPKRWCPSPGCQATTRPCVPSCERLLRSLGRRDGRGAGGACCARRSGPWRRRYGCAKRCRSSCKA